MDTLSDYNFIPLACQSNIYCSTQLELIDGVNKYLIGTLTGRTLLLEYSKEDTVSDVLVPSVQDVLFNLLPGGVEILAIDNFNRAHDRNDIVFGITVRKLTTNRKCYFNIYTGDDQSQVFDFDINQVARNCKPSIPLNYVPYHVCHTRVFSKGNTDDHTSRMVWLVSGSDQSIHVYDKVDSRDDDYVEADATELFPEFSGPKKIESVVTWMHIKYVDDNHVRLTAFGCENGTVYLFAVSTVNGDILRSERTNLRVNIISYVEIFYLNRSTCNDVCLLVVNSGASPLVYHNIMQFGVTRHPKILPPIEASRLTNTCARVADLDFDGFSDVIVGTFAKRIGAYKYNQLSDSWQLKHTKQLTGSISTIHYFDITTDGMKELIVLTQKGIHVYQHETKKALNIITNRLENLFANLSKSEIDHQ